jgi:hypothetical protein
MSRFGLYRFTRGVNDVGWRHSTTGTVAIRDNGLAEDAAEFLRKKINERLRRKYARRPNDIEPRT